MEDQTVKEGKTAAIIGYLTIVGTLIAIFMNQEPKNTFARFHIRQAFGINAAYLTVAAILNYFQNINAYYAFWIFFSILAFYGLFGAFQGKLNPIPVVGVKFQEWFTFIQ